MIQAASRQALASVRVQVESVLGRFSSTDGLAGLADELYSIGGLLTKQPRLRRRMADPASSAEARKALAEHLLQGRVSASALSVAGEAVSQRWSTAWDLVDALEASGDDVLLAAAEKAGVIDEVEDELFRFERIIDAESGLATLLDEVTASTERRVGLLEQVLGGKVHALTLALVRHAVVAQRKRSVRLALDDLIEAAGVRRERYVARVISAVPMTDHQQGALADQLSQLYGRRIEVRYAIDPSIRGGLVVRVGDEIIDGSVAARLAQIRNAFAS
ncbi:MAG TPA: F0F1 ATP synthase subunit delta [Jatrophihabitantaceae bacterium]|nr:F0F1 ATP synthase subunit delta [Jatrophihabitantaceae bacterium]